MSKEITLYNLLEAINNLGDSLGQKIEKNAEMIQANSELILDNLKEIQENKRHIQENRKFILENKEHIQENRKSILENTEEIQENRNLIDGFATASQKQFIQVITRLDHIDDMLEISNKHIDLHHSEIKQLKYRLDHHQIV